RRANTSAEDWNQVSSVQETQRITNIEIDWGLVGEEAVAERRNLTLTSGDYPEAFYRTGVPGGDIAKYGEQGVFVALNDLIDQYKPNLTARMEEYPALRTGLTSRTGTSTRCRGSTTRPRSVCATRPSSGPGRTGWMRPGCPPPRPSRSSGPISRRSRPPTTARSRWEARASAASSRASTAPSGSRT